MLVSGSTLLLAFILFVQCLATLASVQVIESQSDFQKQVLDSDGIWLIQFHNHDSPDAIYEQVGQIVKGVLNLAYVKTPSEIAEKYSVKQFPTYYLHSPAHEKPKKYRGGTDPQSLVQAMMDEMVKLFQSRGNIGGNNGGGESSGKHKSSSKSHVVHATQATYDDVVLNNPNVVLVAFTAPWCGYCKKLMPEWEEAAQRLDGEDVTLVNVDATVETQLASIYGVSGYPTIKYFPGGTNKQHDMAKDYPAERDAPTIVKFALHLIDESGVAKPIEELVSQEILEKTCEGHNKICVLACLPHILDSGAPGRNKYRDMLAAVQKQFRGGAYKFLWMEGGAQLQLEQALELTFGYPAVVAVSLEREAYSVLHGSFSEKSVTSFLHSLTTGRQATVKLQAPLPKVNTVEPWDGGEGAPIEEEMSLDEIMGEL